MNNVILKKEIILGHINKLKEHKYFLNNLIFLFVGTVIYRDYLFGDQYFFFNDMFGDSYDNFYHVLKKINFLFHDWRNYDFSISLGESPFVFIPLILDFLHWPLFLVPSGWFLKTKVLIVLIKSMVLANIVYAFLQLKNISRFSSLIFSIIIAYGAYQVLKAQMFVFSSALLYYCLFLLGFEIFLKSKKGFVLGLSSLFLLLYSPYIYAIFFVPTFIYYAVRVFSREDKIISLVQLIKIFSISILISLPILLPSIGYYGQIPRLTGSVDSSAISIPFFSSLKSLWIAMNNFISPNLFLNWKEGIASSFVGAGIVGSPTFFLSILGLVLLLLSFMKPKKDVPLFLILFLCLLALISPMVNSAFNLFQGGWYRWAFVPLPFLAWLSAYNLDLIVDEKISKKSLAASLIAINSCLISYLFLNYFFIFEKNSIFLKNILFYFVPFLLVFSFLLFHLSRDKIVKFLLLSFVVFEVTLNGNLWVSKNRNVITNEFIKNKNDSFDNTSLILSEIDDPSFYRVAKGYKTNYLNDFIGWGERGTTLYWSFNNKYVFEFFRDFQGEFHSEVSGTRIFGAGFRPWVNEFLGVKYLVVREGSKVPRYQIVKRKYGLDLLKSSKKASLIYVADKVLKEIDLIKYDMKSDILLSKYAVVSEKREKYVEWDSQSLNESLKKIKVVKKQLSASDIYYEENRIELKNISNEGTFTKVCLNLKFPINNGVYTVRTVLDSRVKDNRNYRRYVVTKKTETLCFPQPYENAHKVSVQFYGEDFNVASVAKTSILDQLESTLSPIDFDFESNEKIKFSYHSTKERIVVTTIPFDKDWSIHLNGEKVPVFVVNKGFLGFSLMKGLNNVEINYSKKSFKIGVWITSIFSFFYLLFWLKKYRRRGHQGKP